jgi:ribosomal protein S18 acetylase RimI-like enzyme
MTESTPTNIQVRSANPGDNVLLAEMGAQTFSDAFGPDNTPEDMALYLKNSFSPEIQATELADPASLFLIAEVDRSTVGYARLYEGQQPEAITGFQPIEIVRFYARTNWIGHGVGAALMRACLREAENRGCDTIWLDVWEQNKRAIAFYKKWGFKEVGTQLFRLGDDIQNDLLMQRAVSPEGAT